MNRHAKVKVMDGSQHEEEEKKRSRRGLARRFASMAKSRRRRLERRNEKMRSSTRYIDHELQNLSIMHREDASYEQQVNLQAEFSRLAEASRKSMRRDRQPGAWTLDPQGTPVTAWEVVMCLALLFTVFVVPAEVAFSSSHPAEKHILETIDEVVWYVFMLDMVLQFFTWIHVPGKLGGRWIRRHDQIVREYLKTHFWMDLVASLPMHLILEGSNEAMPTQIEALRLVKLLRIAKTYRILRNSTLMRRIRYESSLSATTLNIITILGFFVLASHWLACIWGFCGNNAASLDNSWMSDVRDLHGDDSEYSIRNPRIQYLYSFYFVVTTLTTVGYGDLHAHNVAEKVTIIAIMIFGGFIWAMILGTVNQAVATLDTDKMDYTQTFDKVNWMLKDLGVSTKTCARARAYMIQNILVHRRSKYSELFSNLGVSLQTDICEEVFAERMSVVFYFHRLDRDIRLALFRRFRYVLFIPSEEILVHKTLLIISNSNGQIGYHGRYHYLGDAIFLDFLTSDNDPPDLAVAIHYTHVSALTRNDLQDICDDHPIETFPILKARACYALLKLARIIVAQTRDASPDAPQRHTVLDRAIYQRRICAERATLASSDLQRLAASIIDGSIHKHIAKEAALKQRYKLEHTHAAALVDDAVERLEAAADAVQAIPDDRERRRHQPRLKYCLQLAFRAYRAALDPAARHVVRDVFSMFFDDVDDDDVDFVPDDDPHDFLHHPHDHVFGATCPGTTTFSI